MGTMSFSAQPIPSFVAFIMIEPQGFRHNYQEIYKPVVDEPMGESYEGLRMMLT
jgi:hypothetical protein